MADLSTCLPLTPDSIRQTHARIEQYIHRTPLITSRTIDKIASSPDPRAYLVDDPPSIWDDTSSPAQNGNEKHGQDGLSAPKCNIYFKMENHQKIGAFKARGAFSALTHLVSPPDAELSGIGIEELRKRGVATHSSGNHAQALALAASSLGVPAWIVMPTISTKSKISGTKGHKGVTVVFSGSTGPEREKVVNEVIAEQKAKTGGEGPILVPPYDHADIVLGQGTAGYEAEQQYQAMKKTVRICSGAAGDSNEVANGGAREKEERFDAVLTPLGGGGLLSGTATWFSHTHTSGKKTLVFGCEPNFEGANDGERGLASDPPERITHVKTLTIADGLRTYVGIVPWSIISDKSKVEGAFSVSETEIKMALKLMIERMKVVIEPSSAVPLAVILFNERFRRFVSEKQSKEATGTAWDVGVVVSGGNTTVEGLSKLFSEGWNNFDAERQTGEVGLDGKKVAEDVAG
ncbi:hypothetical protein PMZ80_005265 [Knufia obscura]|uniref:Tryptophan synthase beta chain-like PALP domain-containing protein n=2 Tax=Knufia TaxID=430999 RepID=A0AAN8I7A2_9EURO|nr:hypothetical protein PMZ80_005265 [Knufia obscura]KAK5957932.1 hypothetical protein OHC33_001122 [Knufia fluminis]